MDDTTPPSTKATQPQVCPNCGAPSRGRAAFCLRCGTRLPDPASLYLPIGKRTPIPASKAPQDEATESGLKGPPHQEQGEAPPPPPPAPPAPPPTLLVPTEVTITPRLVDLAARAVIVYMDLEGRITSLNPAAAQVFSVDAEQAVGRPYTSVFGPSLANRLLRLFMQASRAEDHGGMQLMHVKRADGQVLVLQATLTTQHGSDGAPIGFSFLAEAEPGPDDLAPPAPPAPSQAGEPAGGAGAAPDAAPLQQVVTILHAEVRGYAVLAEALEPGTLSMLLTRYHRAAVAALHGAGATVDHSVVGTILALWNAPVRQSDHARRAIRAALALQEAVRVIGSDLQYAVGIHTGEAQVSNIGTPHAPHYTAIGASVHIATSLQRQAAAGSITCSGATLAASGEGIRADALGPLTIAGQQQGVLAFSVLGITS